MKNMYTYGILLLLGLSLWMGCKKAPEKEHPELLGYWLGVRDPNVSSCISHFLIEPSNNTSHYGTFWSDECMSEYSGECYVGRNWFKIEKYKFRIVEGPFALDSIFVFHNGSTFNREDSTWTRNPCGSLRVTHVMRIRKPFILDGVREEVVLYKYDREVTWRNTADVRDLLSRSGEGICP